MITRRHIERGAVNPEHLALAILKGRYFYDDFIMDPLCLKKGELTTPGGTDLQEQNFFTGRHWFEYTYVGDATDAFLPTLATDGGYNWVLTTATLDRGVEICFGGLKDKHPRNHTPRTSTGLGEEWFVRALFNVDDASGADVVLAFRKAGAYAATLSEYGDIAGIRVLGDSSSALAALSVVTNLNNVAATDSYTSTALTQTLTDGSSVELEVWSKAGKQRYFVNGVRVGQAAEYTYDAGDSFAPVARLLQATDIAAQLKLLAVEGGPLNCRRDVSLATLAAASA